MARGIYFTEDGGSHLIDRTTCCADCGVEGIHADTATGEIVVDSAVVATVPAQEIILLASAHGDREAVCDECERRRSDEQIRTLGREAWEAGDAAQTALCEQALGRLGSTRYALSAADIVVASRVPRDAARAECERVIREAATRAMEEV